MNVIELDPDDYTPWREGLFGMAVDQPAVTVTVAGLEDTLTGQLAGTTVDGGIVLEQPDETDPAAGMVTWIALDRIIAIVSRYRLKEASPQVGPRLRGQSDE